MQKLLGKRNFKTVRKVAMSCTIATVMVLYLPAMALAAEYDISQGNILIEGTGTDTAPDHTVKVNDQVVNDHDPSPVVTGTSDQYTLTLDASDGDVNVTFDNLAIDVSGSGNYRAAVDVSGANDVTIELENDNELAGGRHHAGLADNLTGILTIQDADNDGTLTVSGGFNGAGIGGGNSGDGNNITIKGGTVTATGGLWGAGIGGGHSGDGSNITIEGGTVTATGGNYGAGIGSGYSGAGSNITIKGGTVTATGGEQGAGIGGGYAGTGSNITISGSANVSVAGGPPEYRNRNNNGAAIGNGASYSSPGEEVAPDIRNLYPTGSITVYAAGTTVADMGNAQPESITIGTGPVRNPVSGRAITSDGNDASTAVVSDGDAAFFAAVDMQIDDLLKEINTLIAEGRLDEAKALIEKGLTINAGTHQSFNAATLAKLGEASRMGIAVTVNFTYEGAGYSVTIPGNSQIDPATLVDENGYCGFLNLLKYFK